MAISLPGFHGTFCRIVGICSHSQEGATQKLPSKEIEIVSRYRADSGAALARLVWAPETKHFHVDAALRSAFGKASPTINSPISTLRKTLALFEGLTARAVIHANYAIPIGSLPSSGGLIFVGGSRIRFSSEEADIELTGATLTFRRSGIRRIRWNLFKDEVRLEVDSVPLSLSVTDDYLTQALRFLDSSLATYLFGKKDDGKPSSRLG